MDLSRRRIVGIITSCLTAATAVAVGVSSLLGGASGASAATSLSAVTWPSGVYDHAATNTAGVTQFGAYRAHPVDVAVTYASRTSWSDFATNMWGIKQFANFPGTLSVAIPLTIGSTTLGQVAAGSADSYYTTWARNLAATGRGNSDIRIGWEFNGNWMPWSAYDASAFVAAFRHVSSLVKSILPSSTIDWNGNWGPSQSGHNPFTELYPGDNYVDVVGVDAYDGNWVPASSDAAFAKWQTTNFGLQDWLNFATSHGKKLAVPEWGLVPNGGGDDPAFIRGMFNFFSAHADDIAYESYFDGATNSIYGPNQMPLASAEYQRLWSQPAAAVTPVTTASGAANTATGTAGTQQAPAQATTRATQFTVQASTDGWNVAHTLSVSGLPGAATGTVTYATATGTLCSAPVINATATCTTAAKPLPGVYSVTAAYSGDTKYAASSAAGQLVVGKVTPLMTLATSTPSTVAGQSVTLSVSSLPGEATTAVTFSASGKTLCTANLVGGRARCATAPNLAPGTYPVTATWAGDALFTSVSRTASFAVTAPAIVGKASR